VSINEEIRASAGTHLDLGQGYDAAVAEGLVERIGEEIDRRVDARLAAYRGQGLPAGPAPAPASVREAARRPGGAAPVVLALGSMALAIGATIGVLHPGNDHPLADPAAPLILLIWAAAVIINVAYARRR
jgi:hypothetical protein